MATELRLPRLSDEMEEGTVSRWLKAVGEPVARDEPLVEVETEKVIVEVASPQDGVLLEIVAPEQAVVPVDGVLALIGAVGEQPAAAPRAKAAAPPAALESAALEPASNVVRMVQPPTPEAAPEPAAVRAAASSVPAGEATPAVTPLARRVAGELGIDLSQVEGTGIGGKIIMSDLQPFLAGAAAPAPGAAAPSRPAAAPPAREAVRTPTATPAAGAAYEDVAATPLRAAVARRMAESKGTIPHFYTATDVDVTDLLEWRARLNRIAGDVKITVNDLMVKAAAHALAQVPEVNATFSDGVTRRYTAAHIGVAVAIPGGLVTPVVRDCGGKSLSAIAREAAALVEKARGRTLAAADMEGGTFTISNLGMHDVVEFAAIINPPQVAILAVARPVEQPVARNGWVVVRSRLRATLSADHRALDGVTAARFLESFKAVLEAPERLAL